MSTHDDKTIPLCLLRLQAHAGLVPHVSARLRVSTCEIDTRPFIRLVADESHDSAEILVPMASRDALIAALQALPATVAEGPDPDETPCDHIEGLITACSVTWFADRPGEGSADIELYCVCGQRMEWKSKPSALSLRQLFSLVEPTVNMDGTKLQAPFHFSTKEPKLPS